MGNSFSSTEKGASLRNWRLFLVLRRRTDLYILSSHVYTCRRAVAYPCAGPTNGRTRMDIDELGRLHLKTQPSMLACEECGQSGPNKEWQLLGESGVLCTRCLS